MPMDSYPDDEMVSLYNSFVEAVKSGGDMSDFSEDDLLDIFDYASGIPDDATAAEVIIQGARYFPSSSDLLKRKAFLFHQLGQENACREIIGRMPDKSFLSRILNITETSNGNDVYGSIVRYVDQMPAGRIEDGDLMYLVDYFDSVDDLDFVAGHADSFSRISEYPSTIYNELFHLYWEKGDYSKAAEFGRKVTEIEPFNGNAWTELADLYNIQMKDPQAAVECADFALAIDPDSLGAMVVKSSALYESSPDESRRVVARLLEIAPSDPLVLYAEAILNINDGKKKEGIEKLEKALSAAEPSQYRNIFNVLLSVVEYPLPPSLHSMMLVLFETDNSVDAVRWCCDLIADGSYVGAYEVFRSAYEAHRYDFSAPEAFMTATEVLYRMGHFGSVVELLKSGYGDLDDNLLHLPLPLALMYALSRYRNDTNDSEEIRAYLECRIALHRMDQTRYTLPYRLMNQSAIKRIQVFKNALDSGVEPDFGVVDPLI